MINNKSDVIIENGPERTVDLSKVVEMDNEDNIVIIEDLKFNYTTLQNKIRIVD